MDREFDTKHRDGGEVYELSTEELETVSGGGCGLRCCLNKPCPCGEGG